MSRPLLVADSGPLIALAKLQHLDLPQLLFQNTWVPESVVSECLTQAYLPDAIQIRDALASGRLIQVPDESPSLVLQSFYLDPGETAALAVAEKHGAEVLIDERLGRRAAQSLGLAVIGVCGLLLLGKRSGHIGHLAPLLDRLCGECGYYLSDDLRAAVFAAAGETRG